jgi:hypothetical protein
MFNGRSDDMLAASGCGDNTENRVVVDSVPPLENIISRMRAQ